jgi:hypothetical protein
MKKIALLFLIFTLIFSCKKNNLEFTLNGTISDATFSGGLNAPYYG